MPKSNFQILLLFSALLIFPAASRSEPSPDITLKGSISGTENHTYVEVPFTVPPGIASITVTFHYTQRDERTTLDLGLFDPNGFRGWSGGNKDTFTISEADATPSYLPGPILPGKWKLTIGVPNIRKEVTSRYEADIYFVRAARVTSFADKPLRGGPAWYRGDLHMHTAHSDGSCLSQSGHKVPCPVFLSLEAAAEHGLDFIAVTDHNTTSHYDSLRELQPYFDRLLLIPGREITTFWGHANLFGPTGFADFRMRSTGPGIKSVFERADEMHAILSINHPNAPTGEACMGCGWTPNAELDPHLIRAIEAVNGGAEEGPYSGIGFWENQLNHGYRATAIGGSDNHDAQIPAGEKNSIGSPTTVVYAKDLSVISLLDGIRSGHVFIDLSASRDRLLEISAEDRATKAAMGDALLAPRASTILLSAHILNCAGNRLRFLLDGQSVPSLLSNITRADQTISLSFPADGREHWLRPDVISPEGRLVLLGNPVYLNHQDPK
ncbi:MAG: CehA/McbA family metallohydrolase [Acidobacteria bacterium]|nr:CehA/McbA family metallohydrolase [Acidobacteriota bacterium]